MQYVMTQPMQASVQYQYAPAQAQQPAADRDIIHPQLQNQVLLGFPQHQTQYVGAPNQQVQQPMQQNAPVPRVSVCDGMHDGMRELPN